MLHNEFSVHLITFTEEILNGKLHFLCSEGSKMMKWHSLKGNLKNKGKLSLIIYRRKLLSIEKDMLLQSIEEVCNGLTSFSRCIIYKKIAKLIYSLTLWKILLSLAPKQFFEWFIHMKQVREYQADFSFTQMKNVLMALI